MSKNQPFTAFQSTKILNLESDLNSDLTRHNVAAAAPINHVGTKLSSNLQSQNVRRTHSGLEESRFPRDCQNSRSMAASQLLSRKFYRDFSSSHRIDG